jgi:Protein of unknown function (DUF3016)
MKRVLLAFSWLCLASSPGFAASNASVLVGFDNPRSFSDFRIDDLDEYQTAKPFAAEMSKALAPIVAKKAPGGTLTLTFTDVDLEGRQKPWLAPRDKIRFINGWLPLRLSFKYRLQDSSGRVVAQGATGVSEALNLGLYPSESIRLKFDEFYYERIAMERWARYDLNPAPAYTQK